jgi:hypothetical protein
MRIAVRSQNKPSVMNNTKWQELRLGMLQSKSSVYFRGKDLETGSIGSWDCEWYHHFNLGGHDSTEWIELRPDTDDERRAVEDILRTYHIPVEIRDGIYRIYGYADDTSKITYLK